MTGELFTIKNFNYLKRNGFESIIEKTIQKVFNLNIYDKRNFLKCKKKTQ